MVSVIRDLDCSYPEMGPFLALRLTGPSAFLKFCTTSLMDCDGSQILSFKAVATTFRLGSQSKLSVVTPKWSEYSWMNWRFSRFMQSKEYERLFCLDWKNKKNVKIINKGGSRIQDIWKSRNILNLAFGISSIQMVKLSSVLNFLYIFVLDFEQTFKIRTCVWYLNTNKKRWLPFVP